jgi:hypothetical protein
MVEDGANLGGAFEQQWKGRQGMEVKALRVAGALVDPGQRIHTRRLDAFSLQQIAQVEYRIRWGAGRVNPAAPGLDGNPRRGPDEVRITHWD